MPKNICLFFFTICITINLAFGQFSFGDSGGYGGRFKLGQSLAGSLGQMMTGQGFSLGGLQSSGGFGQILGSLINGAATTSSSGGPLTQLATAASTQYMNAIRSNPLLSQFTGGSSSQSQPSPPMPYGGPPSHHPHHSGMYNPMALLGGDSSMYGPPGPPQGGYDSQFGGSHIFPQYAAPGNYYNQPPYGHGPNVGMPPSSLYSGPSSSPYGGHIPSPIHHLDRKK